MDDSDDAVEDQQRLPEASYHGEIPGFDGDHLWTESDDSDAEEDGEDETAKAEVVASLFSPIPPVGQAAEPAELEVTEPTITMTPLTAPQAHPRYQPSYPIVHEVKPTAAQLRSAARQRFSKTVRQQVRDAKAVMRSFTHVDDGDQEDVGASDQLWNADDADEPVVLMHRPLLPIRSNRRVPESSAIETDTLMACLEHIIDRVWPQIRTQLLNYRHLGFTGEDIPPDARDLVLQQATERIQKYLRSFVTLLNYCGNTSTEGLHIQSICQAQRRKCARNGVIGTANQAILAGRLSTSALPSRVMEAVQSRAADYKSRQETKAELQDGSTTAMDADEDD
eukprot:m.135650 g.135650  ORF g.135650 m.135650 type:complete len:337 (+) comp16001_c0_seq1:4058-5068(+)